MLAIRLFSIGILALGVVASTGAQAANQLYQGAWLADSFGNDNVGIGTEESLYFEVLGMPQGVLCNAGQPLCNFASTPVTGPAGAFSARGLGGCTPYTAWKASRPAKGATACTPTPMGACQPFSKTPRYRNPFFFTGGGAPKVTECGSTTTIGGNPATVFLTTNDPLRGIGMRGNPVDGTGVAVTTAGGGINIPAAVVGVPCTEGNVGSCGGMNRTTLGSFNNIGGIYLYSYTYATLQNQAGSFFAGGGPGAFTVPYKQGNATVARAIVNAGANPGDGKAGGSKFGGVMKMLGQLTTKVCYFRNGGCSLGEMNWRYDAIGASAYTSGGVVTGGYIAQYTGMYYQTALMQVSSVMAVGSRFPWTTGEVTVTATGRGPNKTIERRAGYDNRTAGGKGAVQLVTPVITRWNQPSLNFETGGVGILRLEFVPEPGKWMLLVAGLSTLAVVYRARRR
jgi:hypothetical protein